MQIGSKEISLHLDVQPTDRRPSKTPNVLTQWTIWKFGIVAESIVGTICLLAVFASWRRGDPQWMFLGSFLQVGFIAPLYYKHKLAIAWRGEHPRGYNGFL